MDIICAKCGKHFSGIEAAREHNGHCKETSKGEPIHWIPSPKSKITPEEWEKLVKLINPKDVSPATKPSNVEPKAIESKSPIDSAETKTSISSSSTAGSKGSPDEKKADKSGIKKTANYRIQNWLIALLFIFSLSVIGWGISLFIGVFIPFWILFIFSFIYSIEKWFYYLTRKHKPIGKLYRLFLNLSILYVLGLIIWSGIKLFSQQFIYSPLAGSLIFLAEFVSFIWMWRVVAKNSWRRPSMKLTIFSLICLVVIFAFAGVPPMSVYKDNLVTSWNTFQAEREEERKQAEAQQEKERPEPYGALQFKTFTDESTGLRVEYPEGWIFENIPTGDELSTRVSFEGITGQSSSILCSLLIGYNSNFTDARGLWTSMVNLASASLINEGSTTIAGVQGYELTQEINGENSRIFVGEWKSGLLLAYRSHPIDALTLGEVNTLNNYLEHLIVTASIVEPKSDLPEPPPIKPLVPIPKPESVLPEIEEPKTRNPSWEELEAFLLKDDTDKMEYVFPTTVCEDFAKKLQKNAKEAGWRCAFVSVQLDGYPDWANLGIPSYTGHACNAFETTDRGLVYIDCTSTIGSHPLHQDAIIDVKIGNDYIPKLIFPSYGWSSSARNMGKIVGINTVRW